MGRSVSKPSGCAAVCYATTEDYWGTDEETGREIEGEWDWIIEDISEYAKSKFPSFKHCEKWVGDEDYAILENDYAYIGISEYCGLIAIWLLPKKIDWGYSDSGLIMGRQKKWIAQVTPTFEKMFGTLTKLGTYSNGEAIFQRKAG